MPWQAASYAILGDDAPTVVQAPVLVKRALLLLLTLVFEPTNGFDAYGEPTTSPCETVFRTFTDLEGSEPLSPKVSFPNLFATLCRYEDRCTPPPLRVGFENALCTPTQLAFGSYSTLLSGPRAD